MHRRRFVSRRPVMKRTFEYVVREPTTEEDEDVPPGDKGRTNQKLASELHLPVASSTPRKPSGITSTSSPVIDDSPILSAGSVSSFPPSIEKRHSLAMADGTSVPVPSTSNSSLYVSHSTSKNHSARQREAFSLKAPDRTVQFPGRTVQTSRGVDQMDKQQFSYQLRARPLVAEPQKRKHSSGTSTQRRKKQADLSDREDVSDADSILSAEGNHRSVQLMSWNDRTRKASSLSHLDVILTSLRHICRYQRQITPDPLCLDSVSAFYNQCKDHLLSLMEVSEDVKRIATALNSTKTKTAKAKKRLLQLQKEKLMLETKVDRLKKQQLETRQHLQKLNQVDNFITNITDLVTAFSC